jgi:hypothetical protein
MDVMEEDKRITGTQIARRGIWFFMRTILLAVAIAFLCYGVFVAAMNAANLYILATEGMQLRAECVTNLSDRDELYEYFTDTFIEKDAALGGGAPFADYIVTGMDYRLTVDNVSVLPWAQSATLTVTERVTNIRGSIRDDKKPEDAPEDAVYPLPAWVDGQYKVYFSKRSGRWYIFQIVMTNIAPSERPKLTPDMRMTPIPAVTPYKPPVPVVVTPRSTPAPSVTPGEIDKTSAPKP